MKSILTWVAGVVLALGACGGNNADGDGDTDVDATTDVDAATDGTIPDAGVDGEPACVFQPTGEFNPQVECAWNGPAAGAPYPTLDDVVMTPIVVNLTDDDIDGDVDLDDIPDIAFISYSLQTDPAVCPAGTTCGCCNSSGVLRIVSGRCDQGTLPLHISVGAAEIEAATGIAGVWLDNSGGLAAGDIDADGSVDLVATVRGGGTIAFERTGAIKWFQPAHPGMGNHLAGSQPAIADLNSDGAPEVIQGRVVLNGADGSLAWMGATGIGTNGFMGPVSVVSDLDLDGQLELLAGGTAYRANGTEAWSYDFPTEISSANCQAQTFPCDGFTATGNFDADPQGEVVIARAGEIYILNHDGTPLVRDGESVVIPLPVDDCTKNEGGPPTIADFDGDGEPEIGIAGADYYIVVDLECLADPLPGGCSGPGIRWQVANADCSSRVTGSSVFDFEGDGRAEVVYADETHFRVFDGVDGTEKLSVPNRSHTRLEMPIVADVDNDGNAEVVYIENASGGGTTQGIRVLGDATDSWVRTRRIWNQHSYHVTNVSELGAIPSPEPPNWLATTPATESGVMNNFRQNLPDADAFAAPDLTIALAIDVDDCGAVATVCNAGDLLVGPGVAVHFYDTSTMTEVACDNGPIVTPQTLAPGSCVDVTCVWPMPVPTGTVTIRGCVDNAGYACTSGASGGNNECLEANNLAEASGMYGCTVVP